jgi:hypothetical protein
LDEAERASARRCGDRLDAPARACVDREREALVRSLLMATFRLDLPELDAHNRGS